jgi:transcriptional regulator with XRE-family HTH domain
MSRRNHLAENLKLLCSQAGSIAHACKEMGINRQQFNKYLNGTSFPRDKTIRVISEYFKISEDKLISGDLIYSIEGKQGKDTLFKRNAEDILSNISNFASVPSIREGIYYCYILLPGRDRSQAACAIVIIENLSDVFTFRRLTNVSEPTDTTWGSHRGDHMGVVLEHAHWIYLAGIADMGLGEPSLMAVRWLPLSDKILKGWAMVGTAWGPMSLPVAMTPAPRKDDLKQSLKRCRVFPISELPSTIRYQLLESSGNSIAV